MVGLVVCFLMVGNGTAQGGGKCNQDISLRVTVQPIAGSVLSGDGKGAYQDALDGVYNTVVHFCSGTYDATMGLVRSKRSMGLTFPTAIPGSNISGPSPVWANNVPFQVQPFFNVRDILWGRRIGRSIFTTRMSFSGISGPGDTRSYGLRFLPFATDALTGTPAHAPADVNSPNETSYVTVQDIPGNCRERGTTLDKWFVTATNVDASGYLQVGTLHKDVKNTPVHSGQYILPFQLLIEAQSCLPW